MVLGTQNSLFWHSVSISSTSSFIRLSYKHRRTLHFVFPVTYWLASQTLASRSTAWSSHSKKRKYNLQDCQSYSCHAFFRENEARQCDSRRVSRYLFLRGSLQRLDCMQGKRKKLMQKSTNNFFCWCIFMEAKKKMTRREYLVRCVARSSPRLFLSGICFEWSLSAVRTCASRWLRRDACPVFSESITIYAGAAALHAVLFLAPVLYSCFVYTYDCARIPNV